MTDRADRDRADDPAFAELRRRGLLPDEPASSASEVGLMSDGAIDAHARARGALLGGAIGDALGRPGEGRARDTVVDRYGRLDEFHRWRGWTEGPIGTITDDTQLTMVVAGALIVGGGQLDVHALSTGLAEWLPNGRGVGHATRAAVQRLIAGVPWHEAGEPSAGNGAAMRAGPIGLAARHDLGRLRRDAALSAIPTHAHPMAVVSTVAQAFATAWATHRTGSIDPSAFLAHVRLAVGDLHDPGEPERRAGASGTPVRLVDRISELDGMLTLDSDDAFDRLFNGAFVLESLPSAWWCFLRYQDDPEEGLIVAASAGRDSDTVAAMAGTLLGALHGDEAWPRRWIDELEYREELVEMSELLIGPADGT